MSDKLARKRRRLERDERWIRWWLRHPWLPSLVFFLWAAVQLLRGNGWAWAALNLALAGVVLTRRWRALVLWNLARRFARLERLEARYG
jgi:hypothetical protein